MTAEFEPVYLKTRRSGLLAGKAAALKARLERCDLCPRRCGVDRLRDERGLCHSGRLPARMTIAQFVFEPVNAAYARAEVTRLQTGLKKRRPPF